MKSTLEQLYLGKMGTYELIPNTKEYYKIDSEACDKIDNFIKKLSKKDVEEFYKITDLLAGVQGEVGFSHFKEGFKIGLFLGLELREEEENG